MSDLVIPVDNKLEEWRLNAECSVIEAHYALDDDICESYDGRWLYQPGEDFWFHVTPPYEACFGKLHSDTFWVRVYFTEECASYE